MKEAARVSQEKRRQNQVDKEYRERKEAEAQARAASLISQERRQKKKCTWFRCDLVSHANPGP